MAKKKAAREPSTNVTASLRLPAEEKKLLDAAAFFSGLDLSNWLRAIAVAEAKRQLKRATPDDIEARAQAERDAIEVRKQQRLEILKNLQL